MDKINAGIELLLHNSLNEALNGLPRTADVRKLLRLDYQLEHIRTRLDTVLKLSDFTADERLLIAELLRVVIAELSEDDFQTRIGVEVPFAAEVASKLEGTVSVQTERPKKFRARSTVNAGGTRRRR